MDRSVKPNSPQYKNTWKFKINQRSQFQINGGQGGGRERSGLVSKY